MFIIPSKKHNVYSKEKREEIIMREQQSVYDELSSGQEGKIIRVLTEGYDNLEKRYTGQTDVPLTKKGILQAKITADYILENYKIDAIFYDGYRAFRSLENGLLGASKPKRYFEMFKIY